MLNRVIGRFGHGRGGLAVLLILTLVIVGFEAAGETGANLLQYDRHRILDGEVWRLVSGHLVHMSLSHMLLNLAGLLLVAFVFATELTLRQWAVVTVAALVSIDGAFLLFEPDLHWYVGLSGVLHGWIFAGALCWVRRGFWEGYVFVVAIVAKLAWEQWQGPLPVSESLSDGPVAVDAHLYGTVGAALAWVGLWVRRAWPDGKKPADSGGDPPV